jgi:hypothetical protein
MRVSALTVLLAIVIVFLSFVAQAQCTSHFDVSKSCADDQSFNVCVLTSYDPVNFDPTATDDTAYTSPQCSKIVTMSYPTIFQSVYSLAQSKRPGVNNMLCQLRRVFVTTDHTYPSLGIWEFPGEGPHPARGSGKVYIAVHESVLTSPRTLADQENYLLGQMVNYSGPYPPKDKQGNPLMPSFKDGDATTATQQAAILAVLGHELGHILVADTHADGAFGNHPRPCKTSAKTCFKDTFFGSSRWDATKFKGRRWIGVIGGNNGNKYLNNQGDLANAKLPPNPTKSDYDNATKAIQNIYGTGDFVSLFAAASPEEDFIETYKYRVLADVGLNLMIDLLDGNPPTNVLDNVRKVAQSTSSGVLHDKIGCVDGIIPPQ